MGWWCGWLLSRLLCVTRRGVGLVCLLPKLGAKFQKNAWLALGLLGKPARRVGPGAVMLALHSSSLLAFAVCAAVASPYDRAVLRACQRPSSLFHLSLLLPLFGHT